MRSDQIENLESMIVRAKDDLELAISLYRKAQDERSAIQPLPHRDFWGTLRLNLLALHERAEELCDLMHPEFGEPLTARKALAKPPHPAAPTNCYILYVSSGKWWV